MEKKDLYKNYSQVNLKILEDIIVSELKIEKKDIFLINNIDNKYIKKIDSKIKRYLKWEPIEYIINKTNFFWLDFYVDKNVLIPRNETEILVQEVINESKKLINYNLIDIWTGSSNITISLQKNIDKIKNIFVVDVSKKALKISKINIIKYNLENKIKQLNWSLLSPFFKNNYNINNNLVIVANLPYIKNWDFNNMSIATINYEPKVALYWGERTWFELYEKLIKQVFKLKNLYKLQKIILFIEIWFDQYLISKNFLLKYNLKYDFYKDNNWIERIIKIYI